QAANETFEVSHPLISEIDSIGLPMIHGPARTEGTDGRNAVVLPNGAVALNDASTCSGTLDRSPCGTGTSARVAAKHARGALAVGERVGPASTMGSALTAGGRG